jgi:hypothetical protein
MTQGRLRKVRAPESMMPGNPRAGQPAERATENNRPSAGKGEKAV